MTLAETNDATRRALINSEVFGGSPAPPAGSLLARSVAINNLSPTRLQEIMTRLKAFPDGFQDAPFDDPDHASGTFDHNAIQVAWELRDVPTDPTGQAKLLIVSTAEEAMPE